jgi:membrane-associated phospholipid phosphatase
MIRRGPLGGRRSAPISETGTSQTKPEIAASPARSAPSFRLLAITLFVVYMAFAATMYVVLGITFTPDYWVIALFIGAVVLGQTLAFLRDWVPLVFLIFGYEFLRGVAGTLVLRGGYSANQHGRIQVESLIDADKFLFGGTLPTLWLQKHFYTPGTVHWYDIVCVIAYFGLHFVFPLIFAFLLWVHSKERFWQVSLAFLAMTYAGFAIFLLFPAAPPWLAQQWGYVHGVQFPSNQAFQVILPHRYDDVHTFKLWSEASPNPVAAMPSLHAAFPWLVLLFGLRFFGKRAIVLLSYSLLIWFTVVYLGQHWVVDIIGGIIWATIWFAIIVWAWPWITRLAEIPMPAPVTVATEKVRGALPRSVFHRTQAGGDERNEKRAARSEDWRAPLP